MKPSEAELVMPGEYPEGPWKLPLGIFGRAVPGDGDPRSIAERLDALPAAERSRDALIDKLARVESRYAVLARPNDPAFRRSIAGAYQRRDEAERRLAALEAACREASWIWNGHAEAAAHPGECRVCGHSWPCPAGRIRRLLPEARQ